MLQGVDILMCYGIPSQIMHSNAFEALTNVNIMLRTKYKCE